jgi:hypothetical protein
VGGMYQGQMIAACMTARGQPGNAAPPGCRSASAHVVAHERGERVTSALRNQRRGSPRSAGPPPHIGVGSRAEFVLIWRGLDRRASCAGTDEVAMDEPRVGDLLASGRAAGRRGIGASALFGGLPQGLSEESYV